MLDYTTCTTTLRVYGNPWKWLSLLGLKNELQMHTALLVVTSEQESKQRMKIWVMQTSPLALAVSKQVHFKVLQVQGLIRYNIFNNLAASHSRDCLSPYIPYSNWEHQSALAFSQMSKTNWTEGRLLESRQLSETFLLKQSVSNSPAFLLLLNYFIFLSIWQTFLHQAETW